jgi:hypothetical protein
VPNEAETPTHLLTNEAVRWSIDLLGKRLIHPAFIYYLYLRKMAAQRRLSEASSSSAEVQNLLVMPGGPEGRPYYRPLRERGNREGELLRTFWLQTNLAGSWSPASLKRLAPAAWLVNDANQYVIPDRHAALAKEKLLFGNPVSAIAMGGYFLRNDGFVLDGEGRGDDVIAGLRQKFLFDRRSNDEFITMFDRTVPEVGFSWFEPVDPTAPTHPTESQPAGPAESTV